MERKMSAINNTREKIIRKGAELIHLNGYNATGLQEILNEAGVPKGSFYFYFKSKEDFGIEVIDYFSSFIEKIFKKHLNDQSRPPLLRFEKLINFYSTLLKKEDFKLGCPIGNLSLEMADTNERFRKRLNISIDKLVEILESCLEEAKRDGYLSGGTNIAEAARFIFYGFEGALLHMKVSKNITPLKIFKSSVDTYLQCNQ